jgi:superfamily II DNA/RNA helicase
MSQHTDTKFFTNSEDNTLYDRFNKTLSNNAQFFDVLVWYFRSSWFFKLYESLEKIETIRVLVWLSVDKRSFDLIEQVRKSKEEAKEDYLYWVEQEFETTDDKIEVEEWVKKFIEFIESWKLEIRVYPKADIHAKVYIIREDPEKSSDFWRVITWSSNFSMNGLQANLEFNVELKDSPDVKYALDSFEELWKDWVDISNEYVDTVKTKTWLNTDITPYDLYLKFLFEYFNIRINDDKRELFYTLPKWFLELEYQKDAVKEALIKLDTYNWFFLADVVWLWKTFIAALIWQQLKWNILIICPPHLQDYWNNTFLDFKVPCQVESLWQLKKIKDNWHEKYDYIFIDEWHRFRNDDTKSYELLRSICRKKKIIIISATPYNNNFDDLKNLIYLFQIPRDSNIPNLKNIDQFFWTIKSEMNQHNRKENYAEYKNKLQECSSKIRERLLKYLMIRRTRSEISKYFSNDIINQWLTFPEVQTPNKAMYVFNSEINTLFDTTIEHIKKLTYSRYKPAFYLKTGWSQFEQAQQKWLAWIMKTSLVKRLDSSFEAFKMSLWRMVKSYESFIEMYGKWDIYISKKIDVYDMIEYDLNWLLELVDSEDDDVVKYSKKDLDDNFKEDLENDYKILSDLHEEWLKIDQDPKIEKLHSYLSWELKDKKLIIFTESKETAFYLEEKLKKQYGDHVFAYSWGSDDSQKQKIIRSYDPDNNKKEDLINILITTDVLAEWINLHRSDTIINYDIPWNPTRVIQRIWRINRVWTKHKKIFIYNFFPTEEANNEITLKENVLSKMEAFVRLLWEDAANLSWEEDIEEHNLFDKINSKEYVNQEWDWLSELKYLKELREVRDNNPELYAKISNLPKKSRTWRKLNSIQNESLFTFFKKWDYLKMFFTDLVSPKELDFFETVDLLECNEDEKKEEIDNKWFYELLQKNKDMFDNEIEIEKRQEQTTTRWRSNEKDLIKIIKFLLSNKWFLDHEKKYLKSYLESLWKWNVWKHTIKMTKKFLNENLENSNTSYIYNNLKELVWEEFLDLEDTNNSNNKNDTIRVILSEYFN